MTFSIKPDINIFLNCIALIYITAINYRGNHRNTHHTHDELAKMLTHLFREETQNKWLSRKIKPQTLSSITSNTLL